MLLDLLTIMEFICTHEIILAAHLLYCICIHAVEWEGKYVIAITFSVLYCYLIKAL